MQSLVQGIIGHGSKMGEGWLLTAEMLELIDNGCANIVCTQPFGCLPNHIVGKGMIRKHQGAVSRLPISCAIDYDPGATRVNQENRIKLMLAVARERRGQGARRFRQRGGRSGCGCAMSERRRPQWISGGLWRW